MTDRFRIFQTTACVILFFSVGTSRAQKKGAAALSAKLSAIGKSAVSSPKLPGASLLVVRDGVVLFNQGFGQANRTGARPWKTDEVVRIASMSKSITATLTAVLAEEGKLKFSDPVSKFLPGADQCKMPNGKSVRSPTIAECLSHTAGFKGGTVKTLPKDSAVFSGGSKEVAAEILGSGLVTEPGTKFAYTFRGYAMVARVIEEITGEKFSIVLQKKLLVPLGMKETGFVPKKGMAPADSGLCGKKPKRRVCRGIFGKAERSLGKFCRGIDVDRE